MNEGRSAAYVHRPQALLTQKFTGKPPITCEIAPCSDTTANCLFCAKFVAGVVFE